MVYYLFYFFMNGIFFQYGIEFFQFNSVWCVLFIFGCDVTRHSRHSAFFVLFFFFGFNSFVGMLCFISVLIFTLTTRIVYLLFGVGVKISLSASEVKPDLENFCSLFTMLKGKVLL